MGEIKGMGRRDFLKTAALSGLALGGAAALTGCAPSTGAEKGASAKASAGADVAWDKEVDVLVIGSGTGAFAALVAAAKGAESVCLVEKGTMWGGTAATSGGGLAVPADLRRHRRRHHRQQGRGGQVLHQRHRRSRRSGCAQLVHR